ncbi:MAG: cation:proton antiporter [Paracoccaceae bacterium]
MPSADLLIAIGILFLAGLALDAVGRQMHVPRVTLLILLGAFIGPPVLDLLPHGVAGTNDLYAPTALTMVAFLLGGSLKPKTLRLHGKEIIVVSLCVVIVSVFVVSGGLILVGAPIGFAILLGGLSAATDPAATRDVITQTGASGRFANNVLGIVAIDDAWGLLVFSIAMTFVGYLIGTDADDALIDGLWEVGGAIALGLAIGLPAAYLTGRIKPGEPTLIEAIGIVFLCAGLALWLELSFLLTGMVCGAVIVNLAKHHDQPFHEIERIEWPFMLLFFVMAGASLEVAALAEVGTGALAYISFRTLARLLGGWAGGWMAGLPPQERRLTGLALMPQAGVAIGMALVAAERFPDIARPLLAITIAGTIFFEVVGPLLTQFALSRAAAPKELSAHK